MARWRGISFLESWVGEFTLAWTLIRNSTLSMSLFCMAVWRKLNPLLSTCRKNQNEHNTYVSFLNNDIIGREVADPERIGSTQSKFKHISNNTTYVQNSFNFMMTMQLKTLLAMKYYLFCCIRFPVQNRLCCFVVLGCHSSSKGS